MVFSHFNGGLISYLGYNILNKNEINKNLIYILLIIGIAATLNHSYLWAIKSKLNKMYHFGMEGWIIWLTHIVMGGYLSYISYSLLNKKELKQIDSLILIVLGVLGALYHLHLLYYSVKHDNSIHDHSSNKNTNNSSEKFISFLGKKKYNLKSFIKKHPGGSIIKKTLGKDMSNVWKKYGVPWHMKNKKVQNVLKSLEVN